MKIYDWDEAKRELLKEDRTICFEDIVFYLENGMLLDSFKKGEWIPAKNPADERRRAREYARATMRKDKRVNIRISQRDLLELQRKAVHEGLPYQTFISSLLH